MGFLGFITWPIEIAIVGFLFAVLILGLNFGIIDRFRNWITENVPGGRSELFQKHVGPHLDKIFFGLLALIYLTLKLI